MARVKAEYQQIMYEMEVVYELCKYGYTYKEVQEILAITNEKMETIQDVLENRGDVKMIEPLVERVFNKLYK